MAATNRKSFSMDHPVVILLVIVAVVASMGLAAEVLKPLALSILLAFALSPLCRFFERRGLPRVPAVIVTVVLTLGALGVIGFVVMRQLDSLAGELPEHRDQIVTKIENLRQGRTSNFSKVQQMTADVVKEIDRPAKKTDVQQVRIVDEPDFTKRIQNAVGPYLEFLGVGSFVLILVLFIMMNREDLGDRVIQLFGRRQISLTTRTMDEVGQRISRYLATFAAVNSCYGLVIGVGLGLIGIPYAVLWGFIAAFTRFIPYLGPFVAFSLPTVFAFAQFPDPWHVIGVIALFAVVETILNSFLEPVIYGRTTGVTALGLLVAAMFWTWLWGLLGLLLSTPLTVCLAVLGKYVPSLGFFSILLGEEAELPQDVKFYQRLLAFDEDGAIEIIETASKTQTRAQLFEALFLPTLSHAERDFSRGEIEDRERAFLWRIIGEALDDLEASSDITLAPEAVEPPEGGPIEVSGVPANDLSDTLALRMLSQLLDPKLIHLTIVGESDSPLKLVQKILETSPKLVLVSHLPPAGLTNARYLVRRLKAGLKDVPIQFGRWGEGGATDETSERLKAAGASTVSFSLNEAKDRLLSAALPRPTDASLSPALA